MNFRIVTTASYDYAPVLDFCLPSWRKNSGADDIVIRWHRQRGRGKAQTWFRAVQERCATMREAVQSAVAEKRKLLLLDGDCLVLQNLEDGFAGDKPIAVARWPNVNIGVIFLNTDMDWPFAEFFCKYVDTSLAHIDKLIAAQSERNACDQDILVPMLHEIEEDVAKLDHHVWNFPFSERTDRETLVEQKDTIRVLHLRIGTSFGGNINKFGFLKDMYPGAVPGTH